MALEQPDQELCDITVCYDMAVEDVSLSDIKTDILIV